MPVISPPSKNTICIPIKEPPSWFRNGAPPLYSWKTFRIGGNLLRLSGPGGEEGMCPKSKPVLVGPWISGARPWKVLSEGGTWRTELHVSSVFPFFFPNRRGNFSPHFFCVVRRVWWPLFTAKCEGEARDWFLSRRVLVGRFSPLKIVRSHFMVGPLVLLNS